MSSLQQRTHLLCPFASRSVRQLSSCHNGQGFQKLVISEGQKNLKEDDSAARFKGSEGDDKEDTTEDQQPFSITIGNCEQLKTRIDAELDEVESRLGDFENRYKKVMRPLLSSRGLILPKDLKDPSTLFSHHQVFKIMKINPTYLSSYDIMQYEYGARHEKELDFFLKYLVDKRVCIVEDIDHTISTVEPLMYDHGIRGPEDGTEDEIHKGECDASFNGTTARLSFIIWKGSKIIHTEIYTEVECETATEAEAYAAFSLLLKAHEMKILKLLVCSDSKTVCQILSGQQTYDREKEKLRLLKISLMLKSMRKHFDKLIVTWKPRELMIFADDLSKASDLEISTPRFPDQTLKRWSHHLHGLPVFRIERTPSTQNTVKKFASLKVDESYGKNEKTIFFVEAEEQSKIDCLVGLQQAFRPIELEVCVADYDDKADDFRRELERICGPSYVKYERCSFFKSSAHREMDDLSFEGRRGGLSFEGRRPLVVVFDATVPKEAYYMASAFHVILATPEEREGLEKNNIEELNALTFIYYNGATFPLNDEQKGGGEQM